LEIGETFCHQRICQAGAFLVAAPAKKGIDMKKIILVLMAVSASGVAYGADYYCRCSDGRSSIMETGDDLDALYSSVASRCSSAGNVDCGRLGPVNDGNNRGIGGGGGNGGRPGRQ
jgi:hypothetical protein